jgi:hypothetical protein
MLGKPQICRGTRVGLTLCANSRKLIIFVTLLEGVRAVHCSGVLSLLINLVVRKGLTDVEFE